METAMFNRCLLLTIIVVAGSSIVADNQVLRPAKKESEFSRIDKTHCLEIGNRAAAAWSARGRAIPGGAIKEKIMADYSKELTYRGAGKEVKRTLLQMTEHVVNKAYEWSPPFKTEPEARIYGKEYCEKNSQAH